MTSTISEAALAAGTRALMHRTYVERNQDPMTFTDIARLVLEAAAPHMTPAKPKICGARSRWFDATCSLGVHPASTAHEGRTPDGSSVVFNSVAEGGESGV